jgi:hypothetical protein
MWVRRFGAKPDKKIVDRSSGDPEFMEDATHGRLDGIVVAIDRFWVVCAARGAEWLSGSEQGFDGFVAQDEERCHRPEAGQQRLVAAGVADPADDVFCNAASTVATANASRSAAQGQSRGSGVRVPVRAHCRYRHGV